MTNTLPVFNATLEFLKLGSDMSILSGYHPLGADRRERLPPDIPFPGWVRCGATASSEHNNVVALHALLHRLPGPRFGSAAKHRHVHRHRAAAGLSRHVGESGRQRPSRSPTG
ncbi:MAG: hypothetical protein ACLR8Y_08880 [Alistipes indistinctus]